MLQYTCDKAVCLLTNLWQNIMGRRLSILVCLLTLLGCNEVIEESLGGGVFSNHYISSFADASSFNMVQCDGDVIKIFAAPEDIFRGDRYEALCYKYRDTSYDRMVPQDPTLTACFANEFNSIEITSSADFGDIKAGESLAAIVMFRGATAKTYIEHGYRFPDNEGYKIACDDLKAEIGDDNIDFSTLCNGFYPISKRVSELTSEDLTLLSCNFMSIRFLEVPEIKEHTLTMTFRTKDKEVSSQIDVRFP